VGNPPAFAPLTKCLFFFLLLIKSRRDTSVRKKRGAHVKKRGSWFAGGRGLLRGEIKKEFFLFLATPSLFFSLS